MTQHFFRVHVVTHEKVVMFKGTTISQIYLKLHLNHISYASEWKLTARCTLISQN